MNYLKYVALWMLICVFDGMERGVDGTWLEYLFGLMGALVFVMTIDIARREGKYEK